MDEVMAETHLDTVVPPGGSKPEKAKDEAALKIQQHLAALEAEVKALKEEMALLRGEMREMQVQMPPPEPKWVARLREKLAGK